ncbi:MAG: AAA family ATPase, partial [Gemmatimonadetes bacterium]|nr:AAA family ATPase [Gemmatimonadota bacterium]
FGRHVDFRNAILIMTSNLGSHLMTSGGGLGFGKTESQASEEDKMKKIRADVLSEVQRQFRPEFLNRIDELIVFNPLNEEDLKEIVHIQLKEVQARLAEEGLNLQISDEAVAFLVEKGYDEKFGARPLKRTIQRYVEDALSERILMADFEPGDQIAVDVGDDAESLVFAAPSPSSAT